MPKICTISLSLVLMSSLFHSLNLYGALDRKNSKMIKMKSSISYINAYNVKGPLRKITGSDVIKNLQNKTIKVITSPAARLKWAYEIEVFDEDNHFLGRFFTAKKNIKGKHNLITPIQVAQDYQDVSDVIKKTGSVGPIECHPKVYPKNEREVVDQDKAIFKITKNGEDSKSGVNFSDAEVNCFKNEAKKKKSVYNNFYEGINEALMITEEDLRSVQGKGNSLDILADPISRCIHASIKNRGKPLLYKKGPRGNRKVKFSKYRVCNSQKESMSDDLNKRSGPCASPQIVSLISGQLKLAANCVSDVYGIDSDKLLKRVVPLFNHESHFGINTYSHSYAGGIGQLTGIGIKGSKEHVENHLGMYKNTKSCAPYLDIIENGWNKTEMKYFCNRTLPPKQPKMNIFSSLALYVGNEQDYVPPVDHIANMLTSDKSNLQEKLVLKIKQEMAQAYYNGGETYPNRALDKMYNNFQDKIDGKSGNLDSYKFSNINDIVDELRLYIEKEASSMISSTEAVVDPDNRYGLNRNCEKYSLKTPKGRSRRKKCFNARASKIKSYYTRKIRRAEKNYKEAEIELNYATDSRSKELAKEEMSEYLEEKRMYQRRSSSFKNAVHMIETSAYSAAIARDLNAMNTKKNKINSLQGKEKEVSCGN